MISNKRFIALAMAIVFVVISGACGNSHAARPTPTSIIPTATPGVPSQSTPNSGTVSPEPVGTVVQPVSYTPGPTPDGWRRVQVREGLLARHTDRPLAGFTIDLPPGWTVIESWPATDGPQGWIAANPLRQGDYVPTLQFTIGGGFKYHYPSMSTDPRSDVRILSIDARQAILHLAQPSAIDLGPQVGIYFAEMPGGDSNRPAPSLSIDSDSRGFTDQKQLAQVLTSVRYEEIAELPDLPVVVAGPSEDWELTPARTDFHSFAMRLPPGWEFEELQGIDTLVGTLSNGDIELFYDFGGFAGTPYSPGYRIRDNVPNPPHLMWEEELETGTFWFVRPESPEPDVHGATGVFVRFANPTSGDPPTASYLGRASLNFYSQRLNGEQQERVLAMLRTLELELEFPGRK